MSEQLKPCPFCGRKPPTNLSDTLYPIGIVWTDYEEGLRAYYHKNEGPGQGRVYGMHCAESEGGCGAAIHGDSEAEAIAAWDRRTPASDPAVDQNDDDDPVTLWTKIHQLEAAAKGPDGFATWKDAAIAERLCRVKAEAEPAVDRDAVLEEAAAVCEALESDLFDKYKGRGNHPKFGPDRANQSVEGQSDGAGQCAQIIRALKAAPAAPAVPAVPSPATYFVQPSSFGLHRVRVVASGLLPAYRAVLAGPAVPSPAPMVASKRNFCERYGKYLSLGSIHTCTPPSYLAPQGAQASPDDAKRLMFAMQDIDGFGCIEMDKYDYAIRAMEASKHDEITPAHELQGVRDLIDAAMCATGTDTSQESK